MDRWSSIRQIAAQTLSDYEQRSGRAAAAFACGSHAVLKDLAQRCSKLTVIEDPDLPDNVRGTLDLEEGTITVQPNLTSTQKSFLIAHEIGHRALNHPPRHIEDRAEHVNEEPDVVSLTVKDGVYRAYSERDRWELEANIFAAELLAPSNQVRARVIADPDWTIDNLAAYFGVSHSAMRNQLATALLLQPSAPPSQPMQARVLPPMDESQQQAATVQSPALVIAGPGTGKTRVLVERFVHLVRQGVSPRRILALTFSNKAAEEMRERLSAALPQQAHEIRVATFHSLGLELLQGYGEHIGLKAQLQILTAVDAYVFLESRLAHLPLGHFRELHQPMRHLPLLLQVIARAKDEIVNPAGFEALVTRWQAALNERAAPDDEREVAARCADIAAVYTVYQQWLQEEGYVDFGDLVAEAVRLFDMPQVARSIRGCYDHILVDEFQDINYAGGRLVQAIDGGRGIVWAVGDPRQSIYGWRGASPVNLQQFTVDYPGANIVSLEWNYRSVEGVVKASSAVRFPSSPDEPSTPPALQSRRGQPTPAPAIEILVAANVTDELAAIVERVQAMLADVPPHQIAVLCRHRALARKISDALEAKNIATNWGGQLEERDLFKDVMAVLLLAADDIQGLVRLASLPEHCFSEDDLNLLLKEAHTCSHSAQGVLQRACDGQIEGLSSDGREQVQRLSRLTAALRREPTPWNILSRYLFEFARWPRRLFTDDSPAARRQLATLGQLANMAREFAARTTLVGGVDAAAFIQFVRSCLQAGSLNSASEVTGSGAVNVLTIHGSKGLEWPVVIVPNLIEDPYQHPETLLPPGLIHTGLSEAQSWEDACLFYVAVTRARDRLLLTVPEQHGKRKCQPSRLLTGLVSDLEPSGHLQQTQAPSLAASQVVDRAPHQSLASVPVISYRVLTDFEMCGQKAKYKYVYALDNEDNGYREFHQCLYAVLGKIAQQANHGHTSDQATAMELLDIQWQSCGLAGHQLEFIYRDYALRTVSTFAARMRPGVIVTLRQKSTLSLDGSTLEFVIDEIEEGPQRIFRRHHLGAPAARHNDEHLLFLLAAAQAQTDPSTPFSVRLHYLLTGEDQEITPTTTKVGNRLKKMNQLRDEIAAANFVPNPSPMRCPYCRFNLICPT